MGWSSSLETEAAKAVSPTLGDARTGQGAAPTPAGLLLPNWGCEPQSLAGSVLRGGLGYLEQH